MTVEPPDDIPKPDPFSATERKSVGSHRRSSPRGNGRRWVTWVIALAVVVAGGGAALSQIPQPVPEIPPSTVTSTTVAAVSTTAAPNQPSDFLVTVQVIGDTSALIGMGAGTLLADGLHILTNYHVVASATAVTIITSDGESFPAKIVGSDRLTDLAVVRFDGPPQAGMESVSELQIDTGTELILPNGMPTSVLATDQRLDVNDTLRLHGLIRTDQPTPNALSGGPLLDLDGEVVGLSTVFDDVDDSGYFIPIGPALVIANELIDRGSIAHADMGIQGLDSPTGGIEVFALPADSPLREAGAEEGDIIVGIDTTDLQTLSELIALLLTYREGDNVSVSAVRDFQPITFELDLDLHPDA